jgi:ubiquinol-cytochrome c reductase cytochrome c1 subunit
MFKHAGLVAALCAVVATFAFAEAPGSGTLAETPGTGKSEPAGMASEEGSKPVEWESWQVHNAVDDRASLQRGARNFMNYCIGCHSLKYMRYQRMADDLKIPLPVLQANLLQPGAGALDYITTPMPSAQAQAWFGKVPPDLSLIARSKGTDHVYRIFKTYFQDPSRPTGTDNLEYPQLAMPAVLSELSGVQKAVYREEKTASGGTEKVFDKFETVAPGNLTPEQYDEFVRDTVNFLDYVSEPAQVERRSMGVWIVLFLMLLAGFAYFLKQEYWKDVH